jgi:hypothetical protein
MLFKPGYSFRHLANKLERDFSTKPSKRSADWHGKTIPVKKFNESQKQEYARNLSSTPTSLRFAYTPKDCEWKYVPRMLFALHQEKARLSAQGIFNSALKIDHVGGKECGLARNFSETILNEKDCNCARLDLHSEYMHGSRI